MLSDEHSVLAATPGGVCITGFRGTPRIAGCPPGTLAELERTLESRGESKTDVELDELRHVDQTPWLRPAALCFLRIQPGARDHLVVPLPATEAFVRVTSQVLDPTNVFRKEEQAQTVIRLVEECPAYELVLGNNLASLPDVVRSVMRGVH